MSACRINAKSSKKHITYRILSPAGRAFLRMYKAVIAGLTYPAEPSVPQTTDDTSVRPVSRYRTYAPPPPTAVHPAFRHWEGQHSEHPQPLRRHSSKSPTMSRTRSEISEIDKETKPEFANHWDADDFAAPPGLVRVEPKRRDSCHSDLTVEEQVQFAHAMPIKRMVRTSFYPSQRVARVQQSSGRE
ncbi:hypothetical protein DOTSEDRAFT_29672 [Dothistroma septosporum NZE10]|uniref:Uncharacterized protein n=1 Tax=Dothistroma septosporum (strain NZE10 / CBS 128990) TaxID=675120 RepID=M2YHU8_DOTSN|nr:hypothetical protein DOTSEDRAFT_29672 [Dothistroma septosporum NZE10]